MTSGRRVPQLGNRALRRSDTKTARRENGVLRGDFDAAHERAGVGIDAKRVSQADEEPPTAGREPKDGAVDMSDHSTPSVATHRAVGRTHQERPIAGEGERSGVAGRTEAFTVPTRGDVATFVQESDAIRLGRDRSDRCRKLDGPHKPTGPGEQPRFATGDADQTGSGPDSLDRQHRLAPVDCYESPLRLSCPEPRGAVARAGHDRVSAWVEFDARDRI